MSRGLGDNVAASLRERDSFLFPSGARRGDTYILERVGAPGTVTVFGPYGIPLVITSDDNDPTKPHKCIAAAACLGRGRVVAIAHEGYLNSSHPTSAHFINLCIAWLGGAQNVLRVTSESQVPQARSHLENGGGCIVATCPWGWCQLNPSRGLSSCALNDLLATAGLCFTGDVAPGHGDLTIRPTLDCLHPLLTSMISATLIPKSELGGVCTALDASRTVEQVHTPYPQNSDHLVATFPVNEQAQARAAYGVGGWWAPVCDRPELIFNFCAPRVISGVEVFCVNVEACPKEAAFYASRDGAAWDLLAKFPFPTFNAPDGKGNAPQKFIFASPVQVQRMKVQLNGIHKSFYIGINNVAFLNSSQVLPAVGCAVTPTSLEAMPSAHRNIVAQQLLQALGNASMVAPTAKEQLTTDSEAGQACLVLSTVSKSVQIQLPRAEEFPGKCPGTVDPVASGRAAKVVQVPVRALGFQSGWWYSLRRYANPQSPLTITPLMLPHPRGVVNYSTSWKLRVGCHSDNLHGCDKLSRWPDVCDVIELPRVGQSVTIYPRFGGLLYLEACGTVPIDHSDFAIEIGGSFTIPHFCKEMGFTPGDAPWGEVEGELVTLSLPAHVLYDANQRGDISSAADFWDTVIKHHHQLATAPYHGRRERIVSDVQISCGYMHSGYPIMAHLDFADRALDVMKLVSEGEWGMFHELGHNMQRDWWTWSGTTEVTVNLFTLYTMKHFVSKDMNAFAHVFGVDARATVQKWIAQGKPRKQWNDDPFLALYMYAQLIHFFGWEALKEVFRRYEQSPDLRPRDNASGDEKMQRWCEVYSLVVGRNLAPFFMDWTYHVTPTSPMLGLSQWRCDLPTA